MITRCSPIVQPEAGFNRGTIRSQLNPAFRQIQRQEFRDPIDGMLGDRGQDCCFQNYLARYFGIIWRNDGSPHNNESDRPLN